MRLRGRSVWLSANPTVHPVFEAHASAAPDRPAVTWGTTTLSYGELNARANQLAHHLREKGIGPGSVVGVCLDREPALIEAILAVLKSGAAYVPLDTTYPAERHRQMLSELSNLRLVIASRATTALLGGWNGEILRISSDDRPLEVECSPSHDVDVRISSEDLCYVVFTSGSTGVPKAVAVRHGGWFNLLNWLHAEYELDTGSSSLVVSSLGFDITQRSMMAPLFCGATLHLVPGRAFDPMLAYREIEERRVQTLHCAPSTLYLLVDRERIRGGCALKQVRYVFIGGEALSLKRVSDWAADEDNTCTLLHQYGVAECTDVASSYAIKDVIGLAGAATLPVGAPVYNTTIHILDEELRYVEAGATGEICISGASVGAGYLNPNDLDAAKFTSFEEAGSTVALYRTGDLGRISGDCELVVTGRSDAQVKVRGNRVDLGDVEKALCRNSSVYDAAVVAVDRGGGDQELFAFVLPSENACNARELREWLRAVLPGPMVPGQFVETGGFPLTPNGKVDRDELQSRATARLRTSREHPTQVEISCAERPPADADKVDGSTRIDLLCEPPNPRKKRTG